MTMVVAQKHLDRYINELEFEACSLYEKGLGSATLKADEILRIVKGLNELIEKNRKSAIIDCE